MHGSFGEMRRRGRWVARIAQGPGLLMLLAATSSEPAQVTTLSDWLRIGEENNLEIAAAKSAVQAARKEIDIASALPDPSVSGGYFVSPVETRVGPQKGKVSVSQMIPWPGKLRKKKRVAGIEHDIAREEFRETQAQVLAEIRSSYADYYALGKEIKISQENLDLLKQMESVLLSQYATGNAQQASVLKLQVEMAMLEDRVRGLEAEAVKQRQSIIVLLNISSDIQLPFPPDLPALDVPEEAGKLLSKALATNPEQRIAQHDKDAASAQVGLARQSFAPDFILMSDYVVTGRSQTPMAGLSENGKDAWSVGIGMTIPLWAPNKIARIDKAKSIESATIAREENARNRTRAVAVSLFEEYKDARRSVVLYEHTLLPQARQTISLIEEAYANGETSVLEYLDAQRTLLKLDVSLEKLRARKEKVAGAIDMLLGGALSRSPLGSAGKEM